MESKVSVEPVEEKWIKHYSSRHQILLVGEGDFSFAACLAREFGNASNMVATSLDSQEMLGMKYPGVAANLDLLKENGCTIMHNVDASTMSQHSVLKMRKFDRIVFNFPHAGIFMREHHPYLISLHQGVVRGFLKNGYDMVTDKGEIHVTHKTAHPFNLWDIEKLGQDVGLELSERADFYKWEYPSYENKKGNGTWCNSSFPVGKCSTFKFAKN